ncbi:guanosine polyphosphate pyrophosphohydrolase [Pullulanibacillus camelliae]|uniref:Guanosine polyphosphate pyrophosphohydrolase n=1 Tax=Pullulanibacillus camelliae TaxID=1707096 RepID=A0A8J3DXA5_9BACL|nr:HD domain-containing protein [Pullulanibacillus camelliae]GGE48045.1 guanosine polyphosphate pyrophosphohydrolase [Pullulanibacillus camelliae]
MSGLTKLDRAIAFAAKAHKKQERKATGIPYISHPFSVAMLLSQIGCSEDVVIAGLLHDTLEDTETTYEQLQGEFGSTVAEYVLGCSEPDKSKPWQERKQHTIQSIKRASEEICLIICADKLHNLRSMNSEYEVYGEALWRRFNSGKNNQKWYYETIYDELSKKIAKNILLKGLQNEIYKLF